jgi:hypothetical protein
MKMAKLKKATIISNTNEDVDQLELLHIVGENAKLFSCHGRQCTSFMKG